MNATSWVRFAKLGLTTAFLLVTLLVTTTASAHTSSIDLADFRFDLVADGLQQPTSMAFLPDGRMLVTEKMDGIAIIDPSAAVPTSTATYLTIPNVDTGGERGVLNVVLDPAFATNNHLYVFYTSSGGLNRVMRFDHQENAGGLTSTADFASGVAIWQHPNLVNSCCHQGSGMAFGSDGLLYITVGEDFDPTHSPDLTHGGGKIHRITKDGLVPPGNPFNDGNGPFVDTIWALGLRNPFRATWDTIDDRLLVGVVGGNDHSRAHESLFAGREGANYGWPDCGEGPTGREPDGTCTNPIFDDPIFTYPHAGESASITGGFRYAGSEFPAELQGAYFFGDFSRGYINYLTFDGDGDVVDEHPFVSLPDYDVGNVADLKEGPDGALYIAQINGNFPVGNSVNACNGGCIRRFVYESGNKSPTITAASATPTTGEAPLAVQFTATATDAETDPLTYNWDFGDGAGDTGATVGHTYTTNGPKTITLSVDDGNSTSNAILRVDVGLHPEVTITTPVDGALFRAGDNLSFVATATDPDGPTPTDISWQLSFRHNYHFHPVLGPVDSSSVAFDVPTSGHGYSDETAYTATVVVTDGDGLTTSKTIELFPEKVDVTLASSPVDLDVRLDGIPVGAGEAIDTLIGFEHTISTEDACHDGRFYTFSNWSDGGAKDHTITVPTNNVTYTANFVDAGPCTPPTNGVVLRLIGDQAGNGPGPVATWTDASGNGNDLTAIGDAPTLVPLAAGGHSVVTFDGIDDGLGRSGFVGAPTGASDRTVVMAVRYDSEGWGGLSWGSKTKNKTFGVGVADAAGAALLGVQGWNPANDFPTTSNALGSGYMIQTVVIDSNELRHYRNGGLIDVQNHAFNTTDVLVRLGLSIDDDPNIAMSVAEAIVYDRALSVEELTLVEGYLENTYFQTTVGDVVPPFIGGGQVFGVSDSAGVGDVVGVVSASDNVGVVGFGIVGASPFGVDGGGVLSVVDGSGLVAGGQFVLTVEAVDAAGNVGSETITIDVISSTGALVPGAVLHLEADAGVATNGPGVLSWADQSPNQNNVGATGNPTLGLSPTGAAAIEFDGVGDRLSKTSGVNGLPAGSSDRTVFVVADYDSDGWGGASFGKRRRNQNFGVGVSPDATYGVQGWGGSNDYESDALAIPNDWVIQTVTVAANTLEQHIDGVAIQNESHVFATNPIRIMLGAEIDGSPQVDMTLAAVLIYDRALSSAERASVEAYLNTKYIGS